MGDDGYANVSYKVFNIGEANHLPAYSMELGVALDGRPHRGGRPDPARSPAERRRDGLYHTSPFSLRFVAPSRAYASMMYGQPTMMIELIMVADSRGGTSCSRATRQRLADLDVRPHWGQINFLGPGGADALYPDGGRLARRRARVQRVGRVRLALHQAIGDHMTDDELRLLARYAPYIQYDSMESFAADSVATMTDCVPPEFPHGNTLCQDGGHVLAAVSPAAGQSKLELPFLRGDHYPDAAQTAVAGGDYIDVMGKAYVEDAREMHVRPGMANQIYGHAKRRPAGSAVAAVLVLLLLQRTRRSCS